MNYKDTEKLIKILVGVQKEMKNSVRNLGRDGDRDKMVDSIDKQYDNIGKVVKVLTKQSKKDKF